MMNMETTQKHEVKPLFVGGYFPPHIKTEIKKLAKAQRRTVPQFLLCEFERMIENAKDASGKASA